MATYERIYINGVPFPADPRFRLPKRANGRMIGRPVVNRHPPERNGAAFLGDVEELTRRDAKDAGDL